MLTPVFKKRFDKDIKRLKKRGNNLDALKVVIRELTAEKALCKKYLDHALKGEYSDCRECHVEPDLLLIYAVHNPHITFVRAGSHSDLF